MNILTCLGWTDRQGKSFFFAPGCVGFVSLVKSTTAGRATLGLGRAKAGGDGEATCIGDRTPVVGMPLTLAGIWPLIWAGPVG